MVVKKIAEEAAKCFPISTTNYWSNKLELKSELQKFAGKWGFVVATQSSSFCCSRATDPTLNQPSKKRKIFSEDSVKKRQSKQWRCGCPFIIKFTTACGKIKNAPEKAVGISDANYMHSNGCKPSQSQLVISRKRSGTYTSAITENMMMQIIQLLQGTNHVPSTILRCMLRTVYPASVPITAQDIVNIRMKAKQMLKKNPSGLTKDDNISVSATTVDFNSESLDNDATNIIDGATLNAREILMDALSSADQRWKVESYLEMLTSKDDGFTYRICRTCKGDPVGVI